MPTPTVVERPNRLLGLLPPPEREALEGAMDRISFGPHDLLHRAGQRMRYMYFPVSGVISLMTLLKQGHAIEAATVGFEGMVGLPLLLGGGSSGTTQAMGQIPGDAWRLSGERFAEQLAGDGELPKVLASYLQAYLAQVSQGVACNGVHSIQNRCARWLLESHDRAGVDRFALTQEFLADMLGVTRPSVTIAARTLQNAGLIEYRRGSITVVDRQGLEEASCECYQAVQDEYARVMSFPRRDGRG